ncbi:hypothetical protein FRC04_007138 [Tulasnella sp. 424]|nr:hypothetical protein FRC04_007138 [Tulasnella sp. 424]KAG8959964.1 hypothetical protein FRC05_007144 [Tulasnella sp. 425]
MRSQYSSRDLLPSIPLYSVTPLANANARAHLRRGIFGGVPPQLDMECGLAPWYLRSPQTRQKAWNASLVDTLDALYDMDLRHDIPIMAMFGPIEHYTRDDENPSNARVFTFLSRSIQQSTAPSVKTMISQAAENFLNGIVKHHVKFRSHRAQEHAQHQKSYETAASARMRRGQREDIGPWSPDCNQYEQLLQDTAIQGTLLVDIDPTPPISMIIPDEEESNSLFTPPSSPPSQIPTPATARQSDPYAALTQHFNVLTLKSLEYETAGTAKQYIDPTDWGVPRVPTEYSISPELDFILVANGVKDSGIAKIKCILADTACRGHDCIRKLEGVVGFGLARTVAYLAGRLSYRT